MRLRVVLACDSCRRCKEEPDQVESAPFYRKIVRGWSADVQENLEVSEVRRLLKLDAQARRNSTKDYHGSRTHRVVLLTQKVRRVRQSAPWSVRSCQLNTCVFVPQSCVQS